MRMSIAAMLIVLATGCMPPTVLSVTPAPTDRDAASNMLEAGTSTIKGSALMRQRGGGVVTCAGSEVYLIPATASVTQQLRGIFGSEDGYLAHGGHETMGGGAVLAPVEPNRSTLCNAQGFFTFNNVRAGRWHIITNVVWSVSERYQGGAMLYTTEVGEGAEVEIVLSH